MPSPTSDWRRWTRKNPTAGARTPTTAPAPSASRMNSDSSMGVRRVVPDPRQRLRRTVENDRAPDEHQTLDEVLDGAELVRDVEDRRAELRVQVREESREDSCDSASTPVVGSSSTRIDG